MTASRFSQLYIEKGEPSNDSERFRNRLGAYASDTRHVPPQIFTTFLQAFTAATGAIVSYPPSYHKIFRYSELRDALDAITVLFCELRNHDLYRRSNYAVKWQKLVAATIREENINFRIDENCVVHPLVDAEFQINRTETLAILSLKEFRSVQVEFESAYENFRKQNNKAAVIAMFQALEILALLVAPDSGSKTLNEAFAKKGLNKSVQKIYHGDMEKKIVDSIFSGFGLFVNSLHIYRHGQGTPEPVVPSNELTIHILSLGTSYLRQIAMAYEIKE